MQTSSFLKDAQGGTGVLGALRGKWLEHHRGLLAAVGGLVLAALAVQFATGINFFKLTNLLKIARGFSMLSIASIGQTVVIVGGGLDLSVAEVSRLQRVCGDFMAGRRCCFLPVSLLTLVFGAAVGFNGALVTNATSRPSWPRWAARSFCAGPGCCGHRASRRGGFPGTSKLSGSAPPSGSPTSSSCS